MGLEICCQEHPRYSAQRAPRLTKASDRCKCWVLWRLAEDVRSYWKHYVLSYRTRSLAASKRRAGR